MRALLVITSLLFCGMLRADPKPAKPDAGIHIQIDGLDEQIEEQLDSALDSVDIDNLPAPVRQKLKDRLGAVRGMVKGRLKHLDIQDPDKFGKDMEKLGEDIGKEMESFGSDMDKWGKDFGKQFGKSWAKKFAKHVRIGKTDDDDDDIAGAVDVDDDDDLADAIKDLADLKLEKAQKDQIQKLRADTDKQVAAAKQALDAASKTLHDQLEAGKASDADIAKSIDAVTQQEAAIRKARILAWVHARAVLDDAQRKKVEGAAKGKTK